jgi:hypothetical protein
MSEKEKFLFGVLFRADEEAKKIIENTILENSDLIFWKKAPPASHLRISEEPRKERKEEKNYEFGYVPKK